MLIIRCSSLDLARSVGAVVAVRHQTSSVDRLRPSSVVHSCPSLPVHSPSIARPSVVVRPHLPTSVRSVCRRSSVVVRLSVCPSPVCPSTSARRTSVRRRRPSPVPVRHPSPPVVSRPSSVDARRLLPSDHVPCVHRRPAMSVRPVHRRPSSLIPSILYFTS